jgi:bacillithiol biosynthesis deacetylase BshB1
LTIRFSEQDNENKRKEHAVKLDVIAFGAHADDVELGCGGTIIKLGSLGYKTGVIALTRGELATRGTTEIRAQEFAAAAEVMGLAVHKMLDMPDGRVEESWENKVKVIQEIRTFRPRIVFAPYWITRHPDHEKTSRIVREAAYLAGLKKLDTGQEAHRPFKVIFYPTRFEFPPSFVVDITDHHDRKLAALGSYRSQFNNSPKKTYGDDETLLSRPDFLERISTRDKQYGIYIGAQYGEPFLVREALKIGDPVEFFGPEYLEAIP